MKKGMKIFSGILLALSLTACGDSFDAENPEASIEAMTAEMSAGEKAELGQCLLTYSMNRAMELATEGGLDAALTADQVIAEELNGLTAEDILKLCE